MFIGRTSAPAGEGATQLDLWGRVFSAPPGDFSRVNPWGLALMLLALACVLASGRVAARVAPARREMVALGIKLAGLLMAAAGALGALKLIG